MAEWRDLVHQPSHEDLERRKLQAWQWRINPLSFLLLKCAAVDGKSLRRPVVAYTRAGTIMQEGRRIREREPDQFGDDLLTIDATVYWWDGALRSELVPDLANGLLLRYVSFTGQQVDPSYLQRSLPDSVWDYSCEHPDRPGVRCSGPPCLVQDLPDYTAPVPRRVKKPISFDFD